MVDQHADAAARPGSEVAQLVGQVVDAVEHLDDDALEAQVLAPDLLDELGVVAALDEDPARQGDPRRGPGDGAGAGGGPGGCARTGDPHRCGEDHGPALEQEAGAEGEGAPSSSTVLEGQHVEVAVDGDDLADPVVGDLLHDEAEVGRGGLGPPPDGRTPVAGEHVGAVAVGHGRPR